MNSMDMVAIPPEVYDQNKGPMLVIVIWVFASLALAVIGIKVWTRFRILRQSGIEDLFIFSGWVLSIIFGAILTACVHLGLGKHPFAIDPKVVPRVLKLYLISVPFAIFTLSLPPIAVAILLKHLLAPTRRQLWILYGVPILQLVTAVMDVILIFVQCLPTSTLWDPKPGAKCWPRKVITGYVYFALSYTAFTDLFLAVVPIVAFWKLQLKPKAKIVLFLVMTTTAIAALCAIIRMIYVHDIADLNDYTYSLINHTMWAVLEGNAIIIAACIPGLRPFVKYIRQKQYFRKSHLRKSHRPAPLNLRKEPHLGSSDISALSTPMSVRRMEPRSSGSVSSATGMRMPNYKAYRQNSLAPIMSNTGDVEGGGDEGMDNGRFVDWHGFVAGDEDREKGKKISDTDMSVGEGVDGRD
ncbi:MAG: hypothetical protein Q9181_006590 [Wetmoreana brouardii]